MSRRPRLFTLLAVLTLIAAGLACSQSTSAAPPSASEYPTMAEPAPGDAPSEPGPEAAPTAASSLPTQTAGGESVPPPPAPAPAIPERRRLTLEFPPVIRAGDSDIIRLTLEVDEQGNLTPTAMIEGNQVTGEVVEIPDLYETHHVTAEARLDLAGVEVSPPETISSPLLPGKAVSFYWSVSPREAGTFRGTLWLHLRFVDKASGEESRRPISAQTVEIQGADLLGFSGNLARTLGVIGSVTGTVIGFPFLEQILKFVWQRRRKKRRG